jgi:hypothetical protein
MKPSLATLLGLLLALACACACAAHAQPYYVRGDFHAGTVGLWGYGPENQLLDDGLHGDGAAGDSVYAGDVIADQVPGWHEFKIANSDWTQNWPCDPVYPTVNARVYTSVTGETVHFRLDLSARAGWQPVTGAVACDRGMPPGGQLELIGGAAETGSWNSGVATLYADSAWTAGVHIATPGSYEFKFRSVGSWDWAFGIWFNMYTGHNFAYATTVAGTAVRFDYDMRDGRGRAFEYDETPVARTTWGRVKVLYR